MKLQQDLREFVGLLLSRGVGFVVVGGHAGAFHGCPRMTDDIDLLVRPTRENGQRIVEVLAEFGFGNIGLRADSFTASDRAPRRNMAGGPRAALLSMQYQQPDVRRPGEMRPDPGSFFMLAADGSATTIGPLPGVEGALHAPVAPRAD